MNDVYVRLSDEEVCETRSFGPYINIDLNAERKAVAVEVIGAEKVEIDGRRAILSMEYDTAVERVAAAIESKVDEVRHGRVTGLARTEIQTQDTYGAYVAVVENKDE